MRVAFVGTEIPDHCIEFADMMADSCDALLCIPDRFHSPKRVQPKARLEIDWLPWPRKRDLRNIPFTWTVYRRIRDWKPDVVHFLNESNVWNWLLVYLLKSTPIVTTVHDVTFHPGDTASRRVPRLFANALIRQSNAVIVHGEVLRTNAVKELPVRAEQVYVTPLISPLMPKTGSSELAQQPSKPNDGIFRILFFGRILEYKGLRYLLEAMPLVHERVSNARLIVAGEGDDISIYRDFISDASYLDIRNQFIPRAEVEQLFIDADLLVLPYIEASQSGPLMIAMGFGLPVVTTNVGAMPNAVRSANMGLVVSPKDKLALAEAICKVAIDDGLRHTFSVNAKRATEGKHSRKTLSVQVRKIYQDVIDKHARHSQ